MKNTAMVVTFLLLGAAPASAVSEPGFEGCLTIAELKTGKTVLEHEPQRCGARFSPNSTFKIAAALMAFEDRIFKDEKQKIAWDGKSGKRDAERRNQTPTSWMSESVVWVTQRVTRQEGAKRVQQWLNKFDYGNLDFSGGLEQAWLDSSLKISAHEQIRFLRKLRLGQLPVSARARDLTWKILNIPNQPFELHGKTGTGCIDPDCMGRVRGWFVGVFKRGGKEYVFAANSEDREMGSVYAGPRLRNRVVSYLNQAFH